MLRNETEHKSYYGAYILSVVEGGVKTKICIATEDGIKLTEEKELEDIKTGESSDDWDTVEKGKKVFIELTAYAYADKILEIARPGSKIEGEKMYIKGGSNSLYKHAKMFVLEAVGHDGAPMTFYKGVNIQNLELTFKPGEPVLVPLNIKCFRDHDTDLFGVIGEDGSATTTTV